MFLNLLLKPHILLLGHAVLIPNNNLVGILLGEIIKISTHEFH